MVPPATAYGATIIKGTVIGKDGWLFWVWDSTRKADVERLRTVTQVIKETVALLKAADIHTVIALTPAKARVYQEYLPNDLEFTPAAEHRYVAAVDELRRSGAVVTDLAAAFSALRKATPNENAFFKADTHWTSFGAENAAVQVGREILTQLALPHSVKPGSRLGPRVNQMHTTSDLLVTLPPDVRAEHPPEAFLTRQVLAAQMSSALIEDDAADIVVIGNSFMQPMFNFTPTLSNTLNRPVSLVWKVHFVGPYRTILNYLESDMFKRQRPKAIVWNFHEADMELPTDSKDAWFQNAMTGGAFLADVKRMVSL